jgi:hypothetical protein
MNQPGPTEAPRMSADGLPVFQHPLTDPGTLDRIRNSHRFIESTTTVTIPFWWHRYPKQSGHSEPS